MEVNIEEQLAKIMKEYKITLSNAVEDALDEVSLDMQKRLEAASPLGNSIPHFKYSWDRKLQYRGVRYIGNTKTGKGTQRPLSSILEYSRNGRPFIKRTWEANKNDIFQKFIKLVEGKV